MITYRKLESWEIADFWEFLKELDSETAFMMYEPGERERRTCLAELEQDLSCHVTEGEDFLLLAADGERIIGYIRGERGRYDRIRHTAYIVTGILEPYRGRGIGTAFFQALERWAIENHILRLELTVECHNQAAKALYERRGFEIEGLRRKSMRVEGRFVDEYCMAKLLDGAE